jgi:nucleoside-diphosphate-sugar epimerase
MTILVTGAAGFIGSNLCLVLLEKGFKVIGIDNYDPFYDKEIKLRNLQGIFDHPNFIMHELDICEDLTNFPIENFDLTIHLAGKAGVISSILEIDSYLQTNVIGTKNVLDLMRRRECDKIIFSSSSSVYGAIESELLSENSNTNFPLTPYATSKKASELLLYNYHNLFKINSVILRLFSVYGKNQRPDLALFKFSKLISSNQKVEIFGDGNSQRDFTSVEDVISGILLSIDYLLLNDNVYEVFNIGNGNPFSINEIVNRLYDLFGKKKNVTYIEKQVGDMLFTCADISKAKMILNFIPSIKFEEGLVQFYEWFNKKI